MARGTTVKMWRKTIGLLLVLVVGCFGAIAVNLFRLQILEGENWKRVP